MKNIKVFTAFSGYDSQCMALERLKETNPGFEYELVGWSEIDKKAIASHNAVFPEYASCWYGDITKIDWRIVPDFDLFTYSSPCQSFSISGKREGGEEGSGTTSSLLWECRRAIETKRPKYCLLENVKSLVDKTMYHTFEDWMMVLTNLGYINEWKVLNAADYGIPQHRERTIMVSIREDVYEGFSFPESFPLETMPEDLLDKDVDRKFYMDEQRKDAFFDLLENATEGYEICTSFGKNVPPSVEGCCIKQFVSPACKGGVLPTLMASGACSVTTMYSVGDHPCPGIIEIRKNN